MAFLQTLHPVAQHFMTSFSLKKNIRHIYSLGSFQSCSFFNKSLKKLMQEVEQQSGIISI